MASKRITAKLRAAARILSEERLGDCDDAAILDAVRRGDITRKQVYATLETLGYRWVRAPWPWSDWHWRLKVPAWLRDMGKGA